MTRNPATFVEAVPEAVADREREEPDPLVELDVDSARDSLSERHVDRHQVVLRQRRHAPGSIDPRTDVLLVDEPDGRQTVVDRSRRSASTMPQSKKMRFGSGSTSSSQTRRSEPPARSLARLFDRR